jgi:hypothetical protein
MNLFLKTVLFCLTLSLVNTPQAGTPAAPRVVEISGINIPKTIQVSSDNKTTTLKLNGAGFRNKIFFYRVYIAALYLSQPLTEKTNKVIDVLNMPGPKQLDLTMLRTLTSEVIRHGIKDGVEKNEDEAEKEKLSNQFRQFDELFSRISDLHRGDVLSLQWIPDVGTRVLINGKKIGEPIADVAFFNALLRMWIGANPVDRSLKKQLLGGSGVIPAKQSNLPES